jgi:UDP-N-acetylglucosamine 2-epimerase (non-hydrolysing)
VVTGQTGVDAIRWAASLARLADRWQDRRMVTVTLHRRENWPVLGAIAAALGAVALAHPEVQFVYPMHLNPVVREAVVPALSAIGNFELADPLEYGEMAALMAASELIVTDSGGMVEEGVSLGVPVAVVRNVTERPEGFGPGMAELVGTEPATVQGLVAARLQRPAKLSAQATPPNPYGDGLAARRVAAAVAWRLGLAPRPDDWVPGRATRSLGSGS